jgi:Domain of unknown function (DUF4145)
MEQSAPMFGLDAFRCPHCHTHSHQVWYSSLAGQSLSTALGGKLDGIDSAIQLHSAGRPAPLTLSSSNKIKEYLFVHRVEDCHFAACARCKLVSIWRKGDMIFPDMLLAPDANPDLPKEIRQVYDEAASILQKSPRASAALLRLCVETLCKHLKLPGSRLVDMIPRLRDMGLREDVIEMAHVVRLSGNNAVHPGSIDAGDNLESALSLFSLLNLIAYFTLSSSRVLQDAKEKMPVGKKNEGDGRG